MNKINQKQQQKICEKHTISRIFHAIEGMRKKRWFD